MTIARCAAVAVAAVVGGVISASAGLACVALASLEVSPSVVQPGQAVEFRGSFFHHGAPVVLRWDSPDGPVLATVAPGSLVDFGHAHWRGVEGRFTVPAGASAGPHVVLATQDAADGAPTWGVPARTTVHVGTLGRPAADSPPGESLRSLPGIRSSVARSSTPVSVAAVALASFLLTAALATATLRTRARRRGEAGT